MKFLQRLFLTNFWYEIALNMTIRLTLKKETTFNQSDIAHIMKAYHSYKRDNKNLLTDIRSEYHCAWCSIILAIYRECLQRGYNQNDSMVLTERIIFKNLNADSIKRHVERTLDASSDPFSYMALSSKRQERNFFGSAFDFRRVADTADSYDLRVYSCFYNNYFIKNNAPELMSIACKWDLISWTNGINPEKHGFSFQRPVTLGLDNRPCVFFFKKQR